MKSRLLHFLAFLVAVGTAVAPSLLDPNQNLVGTLSAIAVTALLLGVGTAKLMSQKNAILGGLALAAAIVGGVFGKFTAGTAGFAIFGCLAAVIAQVRTILSAQLAAKGTATLLVLAGGLLLTSSARADINLDDIAPKLTKCWGSTCVMPDAAVNAVLFDLSAKKWEAGTTSLGAGSVLLFGADSPYASGLTAHLTGVLTQETGKQSFAMLSAGGVFMRYLEVAYSRRLLGGGGTNYISVAGNIPWDIFTSATIPQRAMAARARAAEAGR